MTAILGISAFYHDSAAALIVDGEIVAAQPGGMSLPSERVLAAQLLLSLFVTDTV